MKNIVKTKGYVSKRSLLIGFICVVFMALLLSNGLKKGATNEEGALPSITNTEESNSNDQVEYKTGKYLNYKYTILKQKGRSIYGVTFEPFLARNDTVVTGAILEMINQVYGTHQARTLKPEVVSKNGKNLLMIEGIQKNYYFLLVKEDTGEINSIAFWDE